MHIAERIYNYSNIVIWASAINQLKVEITPQAKNFISLTAIPP